METHFTSDSHYGHRNIIDYCERPFDSVEQMNEALIDNYNSVVKPGDVCYHLGDFAMSMSQSQIGSILRRLVVPPIFILGNHDERTLARYGGEFVAEGLIKEMYPGLHGINVGKQHIVLCHYALRIWDRSHRGSWNLFGHSHGTLPDDPNALSIDIGVDPMRYFPVSFEQVRALMEKKTWAPKDHHGAK